jgi:hypothetical protein
MNLDIIGDVHGMYDMLVALLKTLGYRKRNGAWRHPDRTAVFVGDLIDRGPAQVATLDLVRRMVDAGSARCVLGNHEFNAIAWFMPDPDAPGNYLRSHDYHGNRHQHDAFLREVEGKHEHAEWVSWFKTLPLWAELGGVRVVHACWHEPSMRVLRPVLKPDQSLTDDAVLWGSREGHPVFDAIETLCKGIEVTLPDGLTYQLDGDKQRRETRIKWWKPDATTFKEAAIGPRALLEKIPDVPLPPDLALRPYVGPPALFGHYWFSGTREVLSQQLACVDYSACGGGHLVAYRWEGEPQLDSKRMVGVEAARPSMVP